MCEDSKSNQLSKVCVWSVCVWVVWSVWVCEDSKSNQLSKVCVWSVCVCVCGVCGCVRTARATNSARCVCGVWSVCVVCVWGW